MIYNLIETSASVFVVIYLLFTTSESRTFDAVTWRKPPKGVFTSYGDELFLLHNQLMFGENMRVEMPTINNKEDLYKPVYIIGESDYHGNRSYTKCTPFSVCDFKTFNTYIDMLSVDEIMKYTDPYDGNILHDMAKYKPESLYFRRIAYNIGPDNFKILLEARDRCGCTPLAYVNDVELFKLLMTLTDLSYYDLKMLILHSPNVAQYILSLVNTHTKT